MLALVGDVVLVGEGGGDDAVGACGLDAEGGVVDGDVDGGGGVGDGVGGQTDVFAPLAELGEGDHEVGEIAP